jgi:hypothetical protein
MSAGYGFEFIPLPDEGFKLRIVDKNALADLVKWQALSVIGPQCVRADIYRQLALAEPEEPEFTEIVVFGLVSHSGLLANPPTRRKPAPDCIR